MAPSLSLLAACAVFSSSLALVSCGEKENFTPNPNNPKEQTLPAAPFTVKVCVTEPGIDRDSVYVFGATVSSSSTDGKVTFTSVASINPKTGQPSRTFSVTPDVVELALTPWNSITFEICGIPGATPDVPVKVNASSSADVADVVALNGNLTKYTLKPKTSGGTIDISSGWGWIAGGADPVANTDAENVKVQAITDGYTDVRFWNGTSGSSDEHSITIRVRTANHIAVEGFEFALDGKRYSLVETDLKMTAENLPSSAYLCKLPCIARPMEEYYVYGKSDYNTEEVYPSEKFSTIEFLGTIPRNATPDNRVKMYVDAMASKCARALNTYEIPYFWNEANNSDFRWLPFQQASMGDTWKMHSALDGYMSVPYFPADLCYRKAKIFNEIIKEFTGVDYHYTQNYYFRYSTTNDSNERCWWGLVQNLFYGQNATN